MDLEKSISIILFLILISCTQDDAIQMETELPYNFQDGFEAENNDLDDLFVLDGSRWTGIQKVNPTNGENSIELNNNNPIEGNNALRILSKPADDVLSKIDIEKEGFFAPIESTVTIEADFYINSSENLNELFLIDLECCSCWDASVPNNQCPGVRLKMSGENDYLSIERGKILGSTMTHTEASFPKNEWVNVIWKMKLSPEANGENYLAINGLEVINDNGKNMPNKDEFRQEFENNGIDFEIQEPVGYERIQIGATANPTEHEIEIFIDNFNLRIE